MKDGNLTQLIDKLNAHKEVAQWSLLHKITREWQHYVIGERPEATREVTNEQYVVTLYHEHPGADGPAMGTADVTLTAADFDHLDAKIAEGVLVASLTSNRPWSLPEPAEFPQVPLADEESLQDPLGALERLGERLAAAVRKEEQIRLSAAEFYFVAHETKIYNKKGAAGKQTETDVLLELVLLANNGVEEETEHFVVEERRRIQDLKVEKIVAENAANARNSLTAGLPKTWSGPVVIDHSQLSALFEPVLFRVSGEAKHMKLSHASIGDSFLGELELKGEPLRLTISSTLPYGVLSRSFDKEGVPGQETTAVEGGTFRQFLATQRYADYLGVPATGGRGNLVLGTGETPEAELLKGPLYYVTAFSAMMPNPFTGDFAAEIKLGFYIDEHGSSTPVKGGSLTGNLFEALADCRYAQERVFTGKYQGPTMVRFNSAVSLAGN